MGYLLVAHLGLVLVVFIMMQVGNIVHSIYRYIALVGMCRNRQDQEMITK